MNALGYRLPVICLVGVGLAACSAAGENHGVPSAASGEQPGLELSPTNEGDAGPAEATPDETNNDGPGESPPKGDEPTGAAGAGGGGPTCDCGIKIPGIHVNVDGGISVVIDLPNAGAITIATKTGTCKTRVGGVDITGDVSVDLGSGTDVPLLGADLHIDTHVGAPTTISGEANVAGSLLNGVTGGNVSDLHVGVALDPSAAAMPTTTAQALLDLSLKLPTASVGCGCMPAMNGDLALVDVDVMVAVDGCHQMLKLTGDVDAHVGPIWTSMVPLQAAGKLDATAIIADGILSSVELTGDLKLNSGALWCGLLPLLATAFANAKLTLDQAGAKLTAVTQASIYPTITVDGKADLTASFEKDEWSIHLCANADADIILASAKVTSCLDLSTSGVKTCECGSPAPEQN